MKTAWCIYTGNPIKWLVISRDTVGAVESEDFSALTCEINFALSVEI